MNKLIKLSDEHYIVVDDSEIKEGDWYLCNDSIIKNYIVPTTEGDMLTNDFLKGKKITHSTQPLEKSYSSQKQGFNMGVMSSDIELIFDKIKPLSLSEVEEAIYGYSVEKMAVGEFIPESYVKGFKAHKELVKDKLFTIEDMQVAIQQAFLSGVERLEDFDKVQKMILENVSSPTEWNVEINEQGKIKLIN